jgi:deoxyribonuclease V
VNGYGAVDVYYPESGGARAALVVAADERFRDITLERVAWREEAAAYRPGHFFERELPAIQAVLADGPPLELLVVDGYVDLEPNGRPGLGAYVHRATGVPVVGVAKTAFQPATHAIEVRRGDARPLFVTAAGLPTPRAAELVAAMAGRYRLPEALRRVDALSRGASPATT